MRQTRLHVRGEDEIAAALPAANAIRASEERGWTLAVAWNW